MIKISAFKSLIPHQDFIEKVPTKTYTNYSKRDIETEIKNNPYSFLNIISQNKTLDKNQRFNRIRNKLNQFKQNKILKSNQNNCLYIYQQTHNNIIYTGLICAISLIDYAEKRIKIHEKTIKNRELLFAKYLAKTQLYAEPVLIAHDGDLTQIMSPHISNNKQKLHDFSTNDKIKHEIWEISESKHIEEIIVFFQKKSNLYIADGHHRMASSLLNNMNGTCLAYIVSKKTLQTYPFHRVVSNIKNMDTIIPKMREIFNLKKIESPIDNCKHIQMYIKGIWYEINIKSDSKNMVKNLLVSKLLNKILKPIFHIEDERKNKNVSFIPGNKDILKLTKNIKQNEVLFIMNNISINTIIEIANNQQTTPPKSTFILPKLPSGLIMTELL